MTRLPLYLFCLLLVGFLGAVDRFQGELPDLVASQFGVGGEATSWMARETLIRTLLIAGAGLPVGVVILLWAARFLPSSMLNLPERARLWREPEWRPLLNRYLLNMGAWLALATLGFIGSLFWLIVMANRLTPPRLDNALLGMCVMVYLALQALVILGYLLKIMKAPRLPLPRA